MRLETHFNLISKRSVSIKCNSILLFYVKSMRLAFFGSDNFSLRCLQFLVSQSNFHRGGDSKLAHCRDHEITDIAVISTVGSDAISSYCKEVGISQTWKVSSARDFEFLVDCLNTADDKISVGRITAPNWLISALSIDYKSESIHHTKKFQQAKSFDLMLVVSFKFIFPQSFVKYLTSKRRMGSFHSKSQNGTHLINIHPSHLPRFRGASPLFHSLLFGDLVSAISYFSITSPSGSLSKDVQCPRVDVGDLVRCIPFCIFSKILDEDFRFTYPSYGHYIENALAHPSLSLCDFLKHPINMQISSAINQSDYLNFHRMNMYYERLLGDINVNISHLCSKAQTNTLQRLKIIKTILLKEMYMMNVSHLAIPLRKPDTLSIFVGKLKEFPLYSLKAPKVRREDDIGRLCFLHMTNKDVFFLSKALSGDQSKQHQHKKSHKVFGKVLHCSLVKNLVPSFKSSSSQLGTHDQNMRTSCYDLCNRCAMDKQSHSMSTEFTNLQHCVLSEIYPIEHCDTMLHENCNCEVCTLKVAIHCINAPNALSKALPADVPCVYSQLKKKAMQLQAFVEIGNSCKSSNKMQNSFSSSEEIYSSPKNVFSSKICAHRYSYLRLRENILNNTFTNRVFQDKEGRVFIRRVQPQLCYACDIPPGSIYVPKHERYTFIDTFGNVDKSVPSILWLICADYSILSISSLTLAKCKPLSFSQTRHDTKLNCRVDSFRRGFGLKKGVIYPGLLTSCSLI